MGIPELVSKLIDEASKIGLSSIDVNNAQELLEHKEYGLAFDTIITQLYEFEIEIEQDFYDLIVKNAQKMEISEKEYSFMKELIKQ
jgi:hypothetical protein